VVYWEIIRKSYRRNLQYRLAHLVNNVASAVFGFIFISIWLGVLEGREAVSPYQAKTMTSYLTIVQCILSLTTFLTVGLGIQVGVRSGAVSVDLVRPVNYFLYVLSHELGRILYNVFHRSLPTGLIISAAVGFVFPHHPFTYVWAILSLLLAVYLGLALNYLVGISAFWTTEIRWAHYILLTLVMGLGGQAIPVDLLPGVLGMIAPYLPFAGVLYYPAMVYLEKAAPQAIAFQALWAVALTFACLWLTAKARRKMEIQGG
jgi:ABC-2 type transport system permease protein